MKTTLMVTLRRPGFHYWPDAPAEVSFLSDRHRHVFTFRIGVGVSHDNRAEEFFLLQRSMLSWLVREYTCSDDGYEFGSRSCEQLAKQLLQDFRKQEIEVAWTEVWEDDENGARVEHDQSAD